MTKATDLDLAVAHGNFIDRGGAEAVSEELARTFDAPLYYAFGDSDSVAEDVTAQALFERSPVSFVRQSVLLRDLYLSWAAQRVPELTGYDVVLLSKNELAWYVPPDEQVVIHYVHSTPRTPYDLFQQRAESVSTRLYAWAARTLFLPNTKFPDRFVANSELVARRIKRYWGVPEGKIEVVYPPVDLSRFRTSKQEDYYLTYSRLIPEKRIEEIVKAFEDLDARLVVGGTGPEKDRLKQIAPTNVDLVGYMSEEEKIERLSEARAVIFNAQNEDFGLVPVEAFASGVPVLGANEGYTKYQIQEGKNGYTHEWMPEGIRESVLRFEREGVNWSPEEIREYASRYGLGQFKRKITRLVEQTNADASISVENTGDVTL